MTRIPAIACALMCLLAGCARIRSSSSGVEQISEVSVRKLTVEAIAKMPDDKVVEQLTGIADAAIDNAADPRGACLALPTGLQILYTTSSVDGEVNNGGFHQFFWNMSGKTADIALTSLKTLGDTDRVALLQEAIRIHALEVKGPIPDTGDMVAFHESEAKSKLGPLDDKYYKLKTDLSKIQLRYVRAHPEDFIRR